MFQKVPPFLAYVVHHWLSIPVLTVTWSQEALWFPLHFRGILDLYLEDHYLGCTKSLSENMPAYQALCHSKWPGLEAVLLTVSDDVSSFTVFTLWSFMLLSTDPQFSYYPKDVVWIPCTNKIKAAFIHLFTAKGKEAFGKQESGSCNGKNIILRATHNWA